MESHERSLLGKENEVIHRILLRILEKWRMEMGASEEDLEKTVILSSGNIEQGKTPSQSKPIKEMEEAIPETVVLHPKENKSGTPIASPVVKSKELDFHQRPGEPPDEDELLEETVILKPGKIREKANE
jgi:hypothetical protein